MAEEEKMTPEGEVPENECKEEQQEKQGGEEKVDIVKGIEQLEAMLTESEKKAESLAKQLDDSKNVYQRTLAEYDNYRKRTTKEKAENYNSGLTAAVNAILPIVDTLEMALAAPTEDENFKKGIEMTMTKAVESLKSLGVAEIKALNKPFDPNFHSRVMQEETEGVEPNVVVKVFQKGYTLNNKVIRHAKVAVSC